MMMLPVLMMLPVWRKDYIWWRYPFIAKTMYDDVTRLTQRLCMMILPVWRKDYAWWRYPFDAKTMYDDVTRLTRRLCMMMLPVWRKDYVWWCYPFDAKTMYDDVTRLTQRLCMMMIIPIWRSAIIHLVFKPLCFEVWLDSGIFLDVLLT